MNAGGKKGSGGGHVRLPVIIIIIELVAQGDNFARFCFNFHSHPTKQYIQITQSGPIPL